jgi:hypothetical protein
MASRSATLKLANSHTVFEVGISQSRINPGSLLLGNLTRPWSILILTAHQPSYLPWLGLMHKIACSDMFVLLDEVQYVPQDWISRNQIKSQDGPLRLTVPVFTRGHLNRKISEIEVQNNLPWRRKHWRSIEANYRDAKYFSRYSTFVEELYKSNWSHIAELDASILGWFIEVLGIETTIIKMSDFSFQRRKSELLLEMCLQFGASAFLFGAQGILYANVDDFRKEGIEPIFQNYIHPSYQQLHGDFTPYMSTLDLLFNEGPKSLDILMSGNVSRLELRDSFIGR